MDQNTQNYTTQQQNTSNILQLGNPKTPRHHKLFGGSSYDRYADVILFMWDDIKKKYPDAELHFCYGWDLFDRATVNNPERQEWKKSVQVLMKQDGVIDHGRLGKEELAKIRKECGIWVYPTYFTEINCITALECQRDGLVPVTMTLAALDETVQSGIKIDGNINDPKVRDEYLKELLDMMGDKKKWEKESKKAVEWASKFDWSRIAKEWTNIFRPNRSPLVTILTPTIRKGFWNIMAHNISNQTYKNIEWIVVDGREENREKYMVEACKKHGVTGKYLKEKKRSVKRNYSLINANNTGWRSAAGELCVWLQDFVLMPEDGIERLVDIYLHNPSTLIAPVDKYYHSKIKPDIESEDWFNGKTDVVGEFKWANIRTKGKGIYSTDNPFDYEANYGAIPKKILELLGGWWEFQDDGLGYDNTDIAYRALMLGANITIDAENVATCIDHWEPLKDKEEELGKERTHNLNDARYQWLVDQTNKGKLPLVRNQETDDKISLKTEIPKKLDATQAAIWVRENTPRLVKEWGGA